MLLIAHRGYSDERPENTFSSFDHAIDSGYVNLEFDVRLTSDHVPVIIHDPEVDRTTNGTGFVHEMTAPQIKALDAGSWFTSKGTDGPHHQRIPTLEEMLQRYNGKANIFIELKSPEKELIRNIHSILRTSGWLRGNQSSTKSLGQLFIMSFDSTQLLRSSEAIPAVPHGLLVPEINSSAVQKCVMNGWRGILPFVGGLSGPIVNHAQKQGLFVGAWGTSTEKELIKAAQTKVDALTVDWPARAANILAQTR